MQMIDVRRWIEFAHKKLDNTFPESFHDRGYRHAMYDADRWMAEHFIEAEPVRHGRWIKTDNGIRININTGEPFRAYLHDCSACGWHTGNQGSRFNYCPNCGAKMDGDKHGTEE